VRHLPRPPAIIVDVGGGPGVDARWLADQGYKVHLVDPVPLHVKQAASDPGWVGWGLPGEGQLPDVVRAESGQPRPR
jgi:hypothetical protein